MNPNSFSILGYLSVLLWLAVPLLWLLRGRMGVPGWLALLLAVLSLVFATINSRTHVSRIQAEVIEASPDALMLEAAKRKAVEEARAGEVADIRFAEDGADDFIDKAGMDDADRKYLDTIDETAEPEWKKQKKTRGSGEGEGSDDLDDLLGGEEVISGVSSDALPTEEKRPAIIMSDAHMATAHRLDRINLAASRLVLLLGVLFFVVDYLARANLYARASFPLPLPASWRNAFTPLPAIVRRAPSPRRSLPEELAWLVRRGDVFVCFTEESVTLPPTLPRMGKNMAPIDVLKTDNKLITPEFLFESLWYGRACYVAQSSQAPILIPALLESLTRRHASRARAKQNIHLVWNLPTPPDDKLVSTLNLLGPATGFSLLLI